MMTLKALRWAAFALRTLSLDELFTALVTKTKVDSATQTDLDEQVSALTSKADLEDLCSGLLTIQPNGLIEFCNGDLRTFVLSPAMSTLDPCQDTRVHEMMAAVCLYHLQCSHKETIFRPWLLTERWLKGEIKQCHMKSYSESFWHEHYRVAETSSRHLPSLLDHVIQSALAESDSEEGFELVNPDVKVNSGLWICSLYDFKVLGKTYLQMGADIGYRHALDETPLHIAAANSSASMLKLLLDAGADPGWTDVDGMNALHHSSISGLAEAVSLLVDHGADVNASTCSCSCVRPCFCARDQTPLHLAAGYGHAEIVKLLLDAGSNLNATTSGSKENALHFAVEIGSEDVVRYLMDYDADPEAQTADSETALQIAIKERHDSIVKLLLERGARLRPASYQDECYLEKALKGCGLAETVHQFRRLFMEQTYVSHHSSPFALNSGSTNPILMIPTRQEGDIKHDYEDCEHDGWLIVDGFKVEMDF
jgi:Ankyrin repeats (3 copies)